MYEYIDASVQTYQSVKLKSNISHYHSISAPSPPNTLCKHNNGPTAKHSGLS